MKKPKYIVIHHSLVSYTKNADQFEAINEYHKKKWWFISSLGYYGGYNYQMSGNGVIRQYRADGERTAAQYQKNMNDGRAISICLDGNFDIENPTQHQLDALGQWLEVKMEQYGIPKENILKHRDLAKYKSCPGIKIPDDIYKYVMDSQRTVKGTSTWEISVKQHPIVLELYQEEGKPEIYILGKDKKYHHIADEKVWHLFFDKFDNQWNIVPEIPQSKIGYPLVGDYPIK